MKIVALVKYVPDASGDREFNEDGTVNREVDGMLSELDEYAVEQSLVIKDDDDAEVIALTVGPDDAYDAIKRALQMGADSGVHINDESVHGSDALATSAILAAAIRKIQPDLVVCGMASTDGTMGVVPTMVAERLGWPALTYATEMSVAEGVVTIGRDDDLASLTVQAPLPAVVSVTDQSGEPRHPNARGVLSAKKKPVEDWEVSDLDLGDIPVGLESSWTAVVTATARPAKEAGTLVTDEDGSGAAAFADFLTAGKYL